MVSRTPTPSVRTVPARALLMFRVLLVVQAVHFAEHSIQLNQHVLGIRPALGLFGQYFDTVFVHVAFNVGIWLSLLICYLLWRSAWKPLPIGADNWWLGLVLFQTYHAIEHVAQGIQHWGPSKVAHPPGIIGYWLPNVIAHYQLNLILTILMVVVYVMIRRKPRARRARVLESADVAGSERLVNA